MNEIITELRNQVHAAHDAWEAAKKADRAAGVINSAEVVRLAAVAMRLEGELRLARQGRTRKAVPADHVECDRCGGFGGHNQWPGFVCFKCDGIGSVAK